ncbi:MAG: PTS galactosamine transporter subunit IIB [Breznakia sp.]
MAKIVLTRIDNRLVHGQVGVTWVNSLDINVIVVVDDICYYDVIAKKIMEGIARTSDIAIRFYTLEEFIQRYFKVESNQRIFLVIKNPEVAKQLHKKKIPIHEINLGNMHYERGKIALTKKVYIDKTDVDNLQYLLKKGVDMYYQEIPGTPREKITMSKVEESLCKH